MVIFLLNHQYILTVHVRIYFILLHSPHNNIYIYIYIYIYFLFSGGGYLVISSKKEFGSFDTTKNLTYDLSMDTVVSLFIEQTPSLMVRDPDSLSGSISGHAMDIFL